MYCLVVHSDDFRIYNEVFGSLLDSVFDVMANIWILSSHILEISRVDQHFSVDVVNLASQTIVLVLASKRFAVKSGEDDSDVLSWLGKHRLTRNTWSQVAVLVNVLCVTLRVLKAFNDKFIVWILVTALSKGMFPLFWS